jgi:hypothetical protein
MHMNPYTSAWLSLHALGVRQEVPAFCIPCRRGTQADPGGRLLVLAKGSARYGIPAVVRVAGTAGAAQGSALGATA